MFGIEVVVVGCGGGGFMCLFGWVELLVGVCVLVVLIVIGCVECVLVVLGMVVK